MFEYVLKKESIGNAIKDKDLNSMARILVMESKLPREEYYLERVATALEEYLQRCKEGLETIEKVISVYKLICCNNKK